MNELHDVAEELDKAIAEYECQAILRGHPKFHTRFRVEHNRVNIGLSHPPGEAYSTAFVQWSPRWLTTDELSKMTKMLQIGDIP